MELRNRQVHLDFHTSEQIGGIAKEFNTEEFKQTLIDSAIDSITVFARCHHGWLYYPSETNYEMIHPNLENHNLMLDQIEAAHEVGVKAPVYTTIQWDSYVARKRPEWLAVDPEGNPYGTTTPTTDFYHDICLNSGYRDYLKEHIQDIVNVVGVQNLDGLFLDIVTLTDCSCDICLAGMKDFHLDRHVESDRLHYSSISLAEFREDMSNFIRSIAGEIPIFYNGGAIGYSDKGNLSSYSHLEVESLPSGNWGYDHFPITMRYVRNFGMKVIGMTGKFHTTWGDFHSLKNKEALEFEVFNMFALGGGASIGDQLHPDGTISKASYDLIGNVYNQIKEVEPLLEEMKIPKVEIAVMTTGEDDPDGVLGSNFESSLVGANRVLQELNYQFDIIDSEMDFSKYKLIILPDVISFSPEKVEKLQEYEKNGGAILGSYLSMIDVDSSKTIYGNKYLGLSDYDNNFIIPTDLIGSSLPKEEFVMYGRGVDTVSDKSQVEMDTISPYFNRTGTYFSSHLHTPSSRKKSFPAITRRERVIYFSHPIFKIYRETSPRWLKVIIDDSIKLLLGNKLITHNGPSTFLTTINESKNQEKFLIHGLNYIIQKNAEKLYTIDEVIPLYNVEFILTDIKIKVKTVKNIKLNEEIVFKQTGTELSFTVPFVEGHMLISVE